MSAAKADRAPASDEPVDEPLKRLGGGRWQTRDERFMIEPQSGTWSVVDAGESDDFGLPLVRGPFKSLTEAKAAITAARVAEPPESPLAGRGAAKPPAERAEPGGAARRDRSAARAATEPAAPERGKARPQPSREERPDRPPEHEEPGWFRDLSPADRGRARRLIERLAADGVSDAPGIVRRDLVGDVPALAAHAIEAGLAALGAGASPDDVVELLAEGRDQSLGVRWRLVDGDGRPITLASRGAGRGRRGSLDL